MIRCNVCTTNNESNARYCKRCGAQLEQQSKQQNIIVTVDEPAGCLLTLIAIIWPIVGIILYILWFNNYPRRASSILTATIIGIVINILFFGSVFIR
ncbi:MAG: hypothetical protein ACNA7U_01965 [Candidatus Izemoplasmataceae bacterium]|jgi:uncharacterized membrane protein YvbJ|uniref:hypothetical protein n=1 Tax=Liberiplasma polymorphum TaxID=3374570 RepID=UPI0037750350